jgi:hypothetical protein
VNRDGTFLDVGCANGHLMECSVTWLAEGGVSIEPFGLEILPELTALACQRLPHWADRIAIGNALTWTPVHQFDFVRTGLEYVPAPVRAELGGAPAGTLVAPGGRLIVGAHSEFGRQPAAFASRGGELGFFSCGAVEVPHAHDHRFVRRAFWLEKPS